MLNVHGLHVILHEGRDPERGATVREALVPHSLPAWLLINWHCAGHTRHLVGPPGMDANHHHHHHHQELRLKYSTSVQGLSGSRCCKIPLNTDRAGSNQESLLTFDSKNLPRFQEQHFLASLKW